MTGVAVEDSDGGQVRIIPDGHVAAAEGEDNTIIIPTSPNVEAGDNVLVSMTGGVSKSPMVIGVVASGDRIKGEIDDFKEYADVTYTHETEFDEVTGAISNTITANYSATAPNISPFFSFDEPAADSITNDYWARYAANPSGSTRNTSATVTPLSDGWLHIVKTAGTSNVIFAPKAQPSISANGKYTLLFEFKNVTVSGTNRMQIANVNYGQLCATGTSYYFQVAEGMQRFVFPSDGLEIRSTNSELVRFSLNSALVVTCDMRVSLYEGEYLGGYKPYSLSKADAVKEYATRSYVSQTADAIELEVSQTAAIANTAGNPNIEPFFSVDVSDTDYWASIGVPFSNLGNGWTRYYRNQTSGAQYFYARPAAKSWVKAGGTYTLLVEIANSNTAAQGRSLSFLATNAQLSGSAISSLADGVYRIPLTVETLSNPYLVNIRYHQNARVEAQFDMRVSLYEGDYKGVFKPYVEDVGEIADTYATKSALEIATDSISSLVQGNATYTDPVSGQTVTSALGTQVTQTASDVSTLLTDVGGIQTMIRETTDGILVAKTGNTVGALVNADGSFDVVELSWSGDTPTIGVSVGSFAQDDVHIGSQVGYQSQSAISEAEIHLCEEGLIHYTMEDGSGGTTISMELAASDSAGYVSNQIVLRPTTDASDYCYLRLVSLPYSAGTNSSATLKAEEVTLYDVDGSASQTVSMADLKKLIRNTTVTVNQSYTGNGAHFETDTSTSASSIAADVCGRNVCFPVKLVLTSNYQFSSTKIAQIADASCYPSQTAQIPVFCISANWSSPSAGWMYINTSGEVMLWTAGAVGIVFAQVNYTTV